MPATRIWTIGHSTRTADEFLELLRANAIDGLADVRTIPRSRRHPHFGRDVLEARVKAEGIAYRHFAELGGLRKPRVDSPNGAWKNAGFRGYADHTMTAQFAAAVDDLLRFGEDRNVAVMCAEAVWWQCHRMLLSDALVAREVDVQHIMSLRGGASVQPHRLTPFAQIREDGQVWYPGLV
ncbi:MAG: DUF488 domain-containing protein [Vicinamibacterales bacterium]